tara:strand:+ start:499 stop:696 length:198 start_codon:yes stop_codon:yes gene_type:complete
MSPLSNKPRTVIKNHNADASDWLQLIIGEIKQYNNWVTTKNDQLSVRDDGTTTFYEPPFRNLYEE